MEQKTTTWDKANIKAGIGTNTCTCLCDLALCVAVERWYISSILVLLRLQLFC